MYVCTYAMDETYYGRPSHNGNPDHGLLSPNGSLFFPQPATADAKHPVLLSDHGWMTLPAQVSVRP
jgi:hypothetical protein